MRILSIIIGSLLLGKFAIASESETFSVRFQPDWFLNGQFAGFYSASQQGYYRDHGLAVEKNTFSFGVSFVEAVASNEAQFGTIEGYILMDAINQGQPLVALGAVLKTSPGGYIFLEKTEIGSGKDFAGKRVGVHAYAEELLPFFLKKAGVAPEQVTAILVKNDIEKLLSGEIDLLQGYAIDEFLEVGRRVKQGARFITFERLGLPMYSMILYTNREFAQSHSEVVHRFMKATAQGWAFALESPETAADTLISKQGEEPMPKEELIQQIEAMKPFVMPEGQRLLETERARWDTMNTQFVAAGLIDRPIDLDTALWEKP